MNDVKLSGRLTKDPELRTTQGGTSVATFTLAVDRSYGKGTDFIHCVAWEKAAQFAADYLHKGIKILVTSAELRVRPREIENKKIDVMEVKVDRIEFCESKKSSEGSDDESDDDLPF